MARRCSLFQTASMILALGKLLLRAGWAPAAVLMFHAVVAKTVWREPLDFTIHFLGGAAIAYFFFYALQYLERLVGPTSGFGRYLFAYALAWVTRSTGTISILYSLFSVFMKSAYIVSSRLFQ